MMPVVYLACVPAGFAWAWVWGRILHARPRVPTLLFECAWAGVSLAMHWWGALGLTVGYIVYFAWFWWRHRGGQDRAAKLLGAKSRAIRDALVRRAREASHPAPLLRPSLGGAR